MVRTEAKCYHSSLVWQEPPSPFKTCKNIAYILLLILRRFLGQS